MTRIQSSSMWTDLLKRTRRVLHLEDLGFGSQTEMSEIARKPFTCRKFLFKSFKTLTSPFRNPTNNRCELMAAIKAIELTSTKKSDLSRELIICSDSHYAWDCMGWITGWKMHNWKTTNGTEVKNRGLIEKLWKGCQDRKPGHCLGFRT